MTQTDNSTDSQGGYDVLRASWQVGLVVGLITLALGIVVTLHPSTSLNVIAVLLGVLLLVGGVFHLVRALDHSASGRAWSAVVGLAFIVLGVVLIRHLHLTRALIALFIGVVWIIQGVAEATDGRRPQPPRACLCCGVRPSQPGCRHRGARGSHGLTQDPGRTARHLVHRHRRSAGRRRLLLATRAGPSGLTSWGRPGSLATPGSLRACRRQR